MRDDIRSVKRQAILESAERIFARHGYHRSEMELIAKAAGIAKGTLYNYFKSKEDLFVSVIDAGVGELNERMKAAMCRPKGVRSRMEEGIATYVRFVEDHLPLFKIMLTEHVNFSHSIKKRYYEKIFSRAEHYENLIRQAVRRGELKPVDAYIASTSLIGMIDVLLFRQLLEGKQLPLRHKVRQIVKLYFEGILP